MYTCKDALAAMDNEETYKVVWDRHFDKIVRSYKLPSHGTMASNPWTDVYFKLVEIHKHIWELRSEYLAAYKNGYLYVSTDSLKKAEEAMTAIVTNSTFFVPLVYLSTRYWDEFCQATIDKKPYDMFMMCITKNLLHMLNVHISHEYFKNLNSGTRDGVRVPRCLFELSRLDFGFPDLAAKRQEVFETVRKTQLDGIMRRDGYLIFSTQKAFCDFIIKICNSVLAHLPECNIDNGGRNILREFSHPTGQIQLFTLAILADYLSENLFSEFKFDIDYNREELLNIEIGSNVLCVGAFRFKLSAGLRNLYHSDETAEFTPLSCKSAIELCKFTSAYTRFHSKESPPVSERQEFWDAKFDYILKLHQGGEAEELKIFAGAKKLWELDYSYSLQHSKKSLVHAVWDRIRSVIHQELDSLVLGVGWRNCDDNPRVYADYGRQLFYTVNEAFSWHIASPEDAQWIMKCRGLNFMGIACISQIQYVNREYVFTEITEKTSGDLQPLEVV